MPEQAAQKSSLPLAVSMGDPSGIGPDILLQAWVNKSEEPLPKFFVVGDPSFLKRRAELLGFPVDIHEYNGSLEHSSNALLVLDVSTSCRGEAGAPSSKEDATTTIRAIERAVACVFDKTASGVVTCPINKKVLYESGFSFPGHTEFLANIASQTIGKTIHPVMMIAGPGLRTVPVTIHIPLSKVTSHLTPDLIVNTAKIVHTDLMNRFGISNPRLAISGLNPHAGESGALGDEECDIIAPAIKTLLELGINVTGPLPADTMFHASARQAYDAALCMYHDQALIPAKMLGFDDAVNVTLGLPFVRTSPDHGTAYDIAGTGKSNPSSFVAAMKLAAEMTGNS